MVFWYFFKNLNKFFTVFFLIYKKGNIRKESIDPNLETHDTNNNDLIEN